MLNVNQVIVATFVAAVVTFFTRAVPFLFFSKKSPSHLVIFIQRYLPPMTMVILVIYCLKDITWAEYPHGLPAVIAVFATFILHLWRRNALISIFGATALYMFLMRTM